MTHLVVGVPTRNRPDLAVAAVESVLSSAHESVSVVVSDNSTVAEDRERLQEFCARQPEGTVSYVRPPAPVPMAEHWEWLWRLIADRLAPTHVTYLTDRFVFRAGALRELKQIVERHPDQVVAYQSDHVDDSRVPVELVQRQWTGRLLTLRAATLIELSSRGTWGDFLPRMLNSVAPTATLRAIERRFGDVFGPTAPDYRFAYRCLALGGTILYLDRSCVTDHGAHRSAGISYLRGTPNEFARDYAAQLTEPPYGLTPEPGFETLANAIFQEYCAVRAEVKGQGFPAPEWRGYLAANAVSVARIEDAQWRARMRDLLERRGWTRRHRAGYVLRLGAEMAGYFLRHPTALARSVKRQLWDRPPGTPAAALLPRIGLSPALREDLRFDSAAQALAHADASPRPRMPYAWHVHRLARAGGIVAGADAPQRLHRGSRA